MPPSRQGTGFVNWGQFVNANRGSAQRVGDELRQGVTASQDEANKKFFESQDQFAAQLRSAQEAGGPSYSGPSSYADLPVFQEGQAAADKAYRDSRMLANVYGREAMLGKKYGATPGYGPGAMAFDSALLGSVGQGGFETTRAQSSGLPERYASGLAQSAERGSQAANRPPPAATAAPSPMDEFVRRQPIQREPDVAVDAPWTGRQPKKRNQTPYI